MKKYIIVAITLILCVSITACTTTKSDGKMTQLDSESEEFTNMDSNLIELASLGFLADYWNNPSEIDANTPLLMYGVFNKPEEISGDSFTISEKEVEDKINLLIDYPVDILRKSDFYSNGQYAFSAEETLTDGITIPYITKIMYDGEKTYEIYLTNPINGEDAILHFSNGKFASYVHAK